MTPLNTSSITFKDRLKALGVVLVALLIAGLVFYLCDPDFRIPEFLRTQAPPSKGAGFSPHRTGSEFPGESFFVIALLAFPIFLSHLLTSRKFAYFLSTALLVLPITVFSALLALDFQFVSAASIFIFAIFYSGIGLGLFRLSQRYAAVRQSGIEGLLDNRGLRNDE